MQALDADITFTEADLTEDIKDFQGTIVIKLIEPEWSGSI